MFRFSNAIFCSKKKGVCVCVCVNFVHWRLCSIAGKRRRGLKIVYKGKFKDNFKNYVEE